MLPTTQQVIDYVREHPNCKSKDIANHFKCNTKDINRDRDGYVGVYKNPEIVNENYTHRLKDVPEPEVQPIDDESPSFYCCIKQEQVQGFPVMLGCCSDGKMCRDAYLEYIDHCNDANPTCPACRSKLYPDAWTIVWHNGGLLWPRRSDLGVPDEDEAYLVREGELSLRDHQEQQEQLEEDEAYLLAQHHQEQQEQRQRIPARLRTP